jgi:hypothetical protein
MASENKTYSLMPIDLFLVPHFFGIGNKLCWEEVDDIDDVDGMSEIIGDGSTGFHA